MNTSAAPKQLQWMINVGVNQTDVDWLERMDGSDDLHMLGNRERIERIYTDAYSRILKSSTPELYVKQTLN
ncbi:hypothetical protein SAMN05880566_13315 [Janthinobacterium sp. TND4EL3]|uniref:hypothetical protein n=1 Tax=Janthinobacterium sp. TND4EL3 TaxID=1907311 RepID=UPI000954A777|nr:hypothetical protein [Janthinobacterium sp. TND4EL3]SIR88085.1 hypothetical protein SAMN05880566_13315 [Janthinobacterium sp. TND4EL3]